MKRKFGQLAEDYVTWQLGQVGIPAPVTSYALKRFRGMPPAESNVGYGSGSYSRGRRVYGKRLSRRSTKYARLLANASVQRNIYGTDNYTNFGGLSGAYYLANWNDVGAGIYRVPLHLWDVTAVPNTCSGVATLAQVGYKLNFNQTGVPTELSWRTLGNPMDTVNVGGLSGLAYPSDASLLRGIKANMMFYCPVGISTKITVSLVQILDDKFHPPKNPGAGGILDVGGSSPDDTSLGSTTDAGTIAFWQAVVHKNSKNPVCIDNGNALRNLKILKSNTFILNPKGTDDTANTTYHQFDFYHKFARRCKYNWQDQNIISLQGQPPIVSDDAFQENVNVNKCSVEPNARMYLMVTGIAKFNNVAEFNEGYWPSYDCVIRTYHDCNQ